MHQRMMALTGTLAVAATPFLAGGVSALAGNEWDCMQDGLCAPSTDTTATYGKPSKPAGMQDSPCKTDPCLVIASGVEWGIRDAKASMQDWPSNY